MASLLCRFLTGYAPPEGSSCSRGAPRAALVLGVKLLPGMSSPRGGEHGNVRAHGEEQAQERCLPDKATLSSVITMGYAYKKDQANVIQRSRRRQFTDLPLLNAAERKKGLMASWSSL